MFVLYLLDDSDVQTVFLNIFQKNSESLYANFSPEPILNMRFRLDIRDMGLAWSLEMDPQ